MEAQGRAGPCPLAQDLPMKKLVTGLAGLLLLTVGVVAVAASQTHH